MFPEEVCLGCSENNEFIIVMVLKYSRVYLFFLQIQGKKINTLVYFFASHLLFKQIYFFAFYQPALKPTGPSGDRPNSPTSQSTPEPCIRVAFKLPWHDMM